MDTIEFSGNCGCGKPTRYIIFGINGKYVGACNKWERCLTYDELIAKNHELRANFTTAYHALHTIATNAEDVSSFKIKEIAERALKAISQK